MQSILPPSAKLCCHPVQRNAATLGDHQRVRKISSTPKACAGAVAVRSGRGRTVALGSKAREALALSVLKNVNPIPISRHLHRDAEVVPGVTVGGCGCSYGLYFLIASALTGVKKLTRFPS